MAVKNTSEIRRNYMVSLLKKNGRKGVKRQEFLENTGVSKAVITRDLRYLIDTYPDRIAKKGLGSSGTTYFWIETGNVVDTPDRYGEGKNDEGYSDPTAATAMKNIDVKQKTGDVWEVNASNGLVETYLVLAATEKYSTCIQLYLKYKDTPESERAVLKNVSFIPGYLAYYNPTKLFTKPNRYFLDQIGGLSVKEIDLVKHAVNDYLKITPVKEVEVKVEVPVEKEVIKEVEKIVEVPVEPEREESSDILALKHEIELAKQKAAIYEDICNKLLKKGSY